MGLIILGIVAIILGAVVRAMGPSLGKPGAAGSSKLLGYGFMAAGLFMVAANSFAVIAPEATLSRIVCKTHAVCSGRWVFRVMP